MGIYAFDQMLSGGRTALFRMITAILIITVICFGLNKRRNFTKLLFKIVGIIFGIILLLIGINMLLNRTGENSTLNLILESIYVYIGAPIQIWIRIYKELVIHLNCGEVRCFVIFIHIWEENME